jgi:hypothetical protein
VDIPHDGNHDKVQEKKVDDMAGQKSLLAGWDRDCNSNRTTLGNREMGVTLVFGLHSSSWDF